MGSEKNYSIVFEKNQTLFYWIAQGKSNLETRMDELQGTKANVITTFEGNTIDEVSAKAKAVCRAKLSKYNDSPESSESRLRNDYINEVLGVLNYSQNCEIINYSPKKPSERYADFKLSEPRHMKAEKIINRIIDLMRKDIDFYNTHTTVPGISNRFEKEVKRIKRIINAI